MVKKNSEPKKQKRTPKKSVDYSEFIKVVIYNKINDNIQRIREICSTYQGIEPAPVECWRWLDDLVVTINREYLDFPHKRNIFSDIEYGRIDNLARANYGLSQKVREMEMKRIILMHIDDMDDNEERRIHKCNMVYQNICAWLGATCKVKKEKIEEKEKSEEK